MTKNELLCRKLGIKGRRRGCLCDGQECTSPDFCDEYIYPKLETDLQKLMFYLGLAGWYKIEFYNQDNHWGVSIQNRDNVRSVMVNYSIKTHSEVLFEAALIAYGL